jgi:hypothetical protein
MMMEGQTRLLMVKPKINTHEKEAQKSYPWQTWCFFLFFSYLKKILNYVASIICKVNILTGPTIQEISAFF